jgi:hypothetical protein
MHSFPNFVGFEVLTAVTTSSTIFWNVRPCRLVEVHRYFRGMPSLLSQKVKAINQQHADG